MKQIILTAILFLFISCVQEECRGANKISEFSRIESIKQAHAKGRKGNNAEAEDKQDNTPATIALAFINSYIADCNNINKSLGYAAFVDSSNLTTDDFKAKLKKIDDDAYREDPEMGLGFDPIIDAQDYPDKGFELESFDEKNNFIVVRGINWADFKITIKVVFKNNKWLIDGCGIINIPKDRQRKR